MSYVLGIDVSSFNVDLVLLDENSDNAEWVRVELGDDKDPALERLRRVRTRMPNPVFWGSVYLAAIEAPYGSNVQRGTLAKLSRVFGAVVASLPPALTLWEIMPVDWRKGLGLPGNASKEMCAAAVCRLRHDALPAGVTLPEWPQDACDAYAVARYARDKNAEGVAATLAPAPLELF